MLLGAIKGPLIPAIVISGVVLLIVFVVGLTWALQRRRRETMRANARRLGLEFLEKDTLGVLGLLPEIPFLQRGRGHKCYNIIYDPRDSEHSLMLFDYRYTTGGGKSSTTQMLFVCLLRLTPPLPAVRIGLQPQSWVLRFADRFGLDFIEFPDDPEFNQRWCVSSDDDEDRVRQTLGVEVRKALCSWQSRIPLTVGITGESLAVSASTWSARKLEDMDRMLQLAIGIQGALGSPRGG